MLREILAVNNSGAFSRETSRFRRSFTAEFSASSSRETSPSAMAMAPASRSSGLFFSTFSYSRLKSRASKEASRLSRVKMAKVFWLALDNFLTHWDT